MKSLGNLKTGILFIVSSPSGAGKSTLVDMLTKEFPKKVVRSVTCTTRKPRPGEQEGIDYHFFTVEEFEKKKKKGDFLEYATVFGNQYGTLKEDIDHLLSQGKHVVLVIDTQGAKKIKKEREAVFLFISPPSLQELKTRLTERQTETVEGMNKRLKRVEEEISQIPFYDYHIINDDLEIAYQVLKSIFIAEEHRIKYLSMR